MVVALDEKGLKEMFDVLDTDHTGSLSLSEIPLAVRAIGLNPTDADIEQILKERDLDNDGVINYDEFVKLYKLFNASNLYSTHEVLELYRKCNIGNDGFITIEELTEILGGEGEPLGEEEIEQIIKHFGKGGRERINVAELIKGLLQ